MKLARALVLALSLLGCGGKQPAASSPPGTEPAPGEPSPGPAPGASTSPGCAQEIAIRCRSGVDGCTGGKTTEHVCVPADAQAGPPCEQEIAMVCPDGQIDGCLRTPRVSANHICVYE